MNNIIKLDIDRLKPRRFNALEDFLMLELINENIFLGGGALRSVLRKWHEDEIADYDIFFRDLSLVPEVRQKLEKAGAQLVFECPEGKLFTYKFEDEGFIDVDIYKSGMKIQLICESAYESPEKLINSFDISACLGACDNKYFYIHKEMIRSVTNKSLKLHNLSHYVATMKRISKYNRKGFKIGRICREFITEIVKRAQNGEDFDVDLDTMRYNID